MQEKTKLYFTSGEFAKLCGTTKETLRHYDSLGLLCPEKRGENSYGYYAAWQFFDYDMINTLKEANCSLKEIKEYLPHRNTATFVSFLREKEKQLLAEQKKLQRMQKFLHQTIQTTEYAMQTPYGIPYLQYREEEYLIVEPIPEGETVTLLEMIERMQNHYQYVEERQLGEEYAIGTIIKKDTLLVGQYFDSYFYTKIPEITDSDRLMIKPAGYYVTMLHKGSYNDMPDSYEILNQYMKEHHLTLLGDSYEYDIVTNLATEHSKDFITEISILVKPES